MVNNSEFVVAHFLSQVRTACHKLIGSEIFMKELSNTKQTLKAMEIEIKLRRRRVRTLKASLNFLHVSLAKG